MNYISKNLFSIGVFLFSIFCFYNYLNFVPYNIYAVSPLFLWTYDFFLEHITNSFVFNRYLTSFFIQFFYSKLTASIVIAFLITALFITYHRLLSYFSTSELIINLGSLSIIAGLFLIPEENIVNDLVSLLIILWFILLLKKFSKHKYIFIGTIIIGGILWWSIQPFFILFLIILPITLLTENKRLSYKIFLANLLLAISAYSYRYFFVRFMMDSAYWLFIKDYLSLKYLLFFLLIIFIPIAVKYLKHPKRILILTTSILTILFANGVRYIYVNSMNNTEAIIKYKFNSEEWHSLLEYAIKKPELSQTSAMCVNYALYKDKHLTDRAFYFNQRFSGDGLLPKFGLDNNDIHTSLNFFYNRNALLLGSLYYNLGLYSMVERIAMDFFAHFENQPQALLLLTKNYLAYGEKEAAAKYAGILEQNPIFKRKIKNLIFNAEKKYVEKDTNNVAMAFSPLLNLDLLLKSPVKNQMALEYYISYSLLERNFSTIPLIIEKLTEYGYTELPHDFEYFTYLAYSFYFYKKPINTGILKNNTKRYVQYSNFCDKLKKLRRKEDAQEALKKYKDSYMYYFICK